MCIEVIMCKISVVYLRHSVVVGCCYFTPGLRLLSQPKRLPTDRYQFILLGVSSLPKATTQWCQAKTLTRDL